MIAFTVGALLPLLDDPAVPAGRPRGGHDRRGDRRARAHRLLQRPHRRRAGACRAIVRNVAGGLLAMGVTYLIGSLIGVGTRLSRGRPAARVRRLSFTGLAPGFR